MIEVEIKDELQWNMSIIIVSRITKAISFSALNSYCSFSCQCLRQGYIDRIKTEL